MADHTPGPWEWDKSMGTWVKMDGRVGARIIGIGKYPEVSDSEVHANARLIAAAPEMLEALELMRDARIPEEYAEAIDKARTAIAKAKGLTE